MQPPQNPFGTPNPYESVPPINAYPPPSRGVSMDVISEAWNKYLKDNIGVWIGAALIYVIITAIFTGLSNLTETRNSNGPPTPNAVSAIFQILSTLVGFIMSGALTKLAISHIRTGRAEIGEMFNIGEVAGNLLIAGILTTLVVLVGLLFCCIPGFIAIFGLSMTTPLIVDQRLGSIDAMKASWEKLKPHLGAFFVLCFVLGLINIAGFCVCGVGILVTIPLTQLALALVYRDLFLDGNIGNVPNTGFGGPPPPIASPH